MTEEIVTIKSCVAHLNLGDDIKLDCYEMPDGEKRVGFAGASTSLGYNKDWLGRLPIKGKKLLQALQGNGYTGSAVLTSVNVRGTQTIAKTISVRDYVKLVTQDALVNQNPKAVVLLAAFAETGIDKIIDDLFSGNNTDYLLQKIQHYKEWTYEEYLEVLEYNREEAAALLPHWR
jgi:hypothetical protein